MPKSAPAKAPVRRAPAAKAPVAKAPVRRAPAARTVAAKPAVASNTTDTVVALRAKAKALGLTGYSRLSKTQLAERITAGK